jgi:hypothetical protein
MSGHSQSPTACRKRIASSLANGAAVVARQRDNELGKRAGLGLDTNPTAMLLDNDVMRY